MNTWPARERAGLGHNTSGYVQKLISVPLVRGKAEGNFDLYYFFPDFPLKKKLKERTLLFCSGGPGRILNPHDSLWFKDLSIKGYRIVYFHLRGSGFSQLPESNTYDEFIRTGYAIHDIDAIRSDVLGEDKKWDAVIGYSYGAVLAQQYAAFSDYTEHVGKLVLIGPISLAKFAKDPSRAYSSYQTAVRKIRKTIIKAIYELEAFQDISAGEAQEIKDKLFGEERVSEASKQDALGIFRRIENNFGSEQTVIERYDQLADSLKAEKLTYDKSFYEVIRQLHLYGNRVDNDGAVNQEAKLTEIGDVIAEHLIGRKPLKSQLSQATAKAGPRTNAPRSNRVFEIMGVYDGINRRFVREWNSGKHKTINGAVIAAGGASFAKRGSVQPKLISVGIAQAGTINEPWNPQRYPHKRPTLILKGLADPVTADGQAEDYLNPATVGRDSILLGFEGVGHEFVIPGTDVISEFVDPDLRGGNADTLNCLVHAFIENDFQDFKKVAKEIADSLRVNENLAVTA